MTPAAVPILRRFWAAAVCALSLLLLASLFVNPGVSWAFRGAILSLVALAATRPDAGLTALCLMLPLALTLRDLLDSGLPGGAEVTEAFVVAFVAGAAWRLVRTTGDSRDRLGRPALVLGCALATGAVVELAWQHTIDPSRAIVAQLWEHVAHGYFFSPRPFFELHQSAHWLEGLALAVFAERTLRRAPHAQGLLIRMWLFAGALAASAAWLRVGDVLLRRSTDPDAAHPHVWVALTHLLQTVRITALFADINAAGSYFAIFVVATIVVGIRRRNWWLLAVVGPIVVVAFGLTQSRSALVAVAVVLGSLGVAGIFRARGTRRFPVVSIAIAALAVGAILGASALALTTMRASHSSVELAVRTRLEMTRIGLRMARQHPVFGVGIGHYVGASRPFISEWLATRMGFGGGENAHNNFLQVLAETGLPAFLAFLWVVLPAAWPWRAGPAAPDGLRIEGMAIASGVAAFLLSALAGHPLLIPEVLAAFFLAVGLSAGLAPAPAAASRAGGLVTAGAVAFFLVAIPWRISRDVAMAHVSDSEGVSEIAGEIDGVEYRAAEDHATWRLPGRTKSVAIPLRWASSGGHDCDVRVVLDTREVNRLSLTTDAWLDVKLPLTPAPPGTTSRVFELLVSDARCRLLVGPIDAQR